MMGFLKKSKRSRKTKSRRNSGSLGEMTQRAEDDYHYDAKAQKDEQWDNSDTIEDIDKKWQKKKERIMLGNISNTKLAAIIIGIFILYHLFYPESSVRVSIKTQMEINGYKAELERLDYQLKQDCVIIYGIKNNEGFLIKYARENLYLSGENEDIYLIEN